MNYTIELTALKTFKSASIYKVQHTEIPTLVVEATKTYIPMSEFKEIFRYIGDLVELDQIQKLIFDKTNLAVFHQPSMEWYFVNWKEDMFNKGLTIHRKILPNDRVFVKSVEIGRKSIEEKYPFGKYKLMDIAYCDTLEKAIDQ